MSTPEERVNKLIEFAIDLHAGVVDAIWTELERQQETERFDPYVDRSCDLIDGRVDMNAVASAAIAAIAAVLAPPLDAPGAAVRG